MPVSRRRYLLGLAVLFGLWWAALAIEPSDRSDWLLENALTVAGVGALDGSGKPLHRKGISTAVPGLYFVGMSGQRSFRSATLRGVGGDAAYVVGALRQHLAGKAARPCC